MGHEWREPILTYMYIMQYLLSHPKAIESVGVCTPPCNACNPTLIPRASIFGSPLKLECHRLCGPLCPVKWGPSGGVSKAQAGG